MQNVLCVDDSRIMRTMIRGTAEVLGLGFLEAPNGKTALEVLATNADTVSLICLDINMPEMSGLELLGHIKGDERLRHIPVMMITTESCKSSIVAAIKGGAANYLCKPFKQEELATKMVDTLGLAV